MFKKLTELIQLKIQNELKSLEHWTKRINDLDARKQWDLETGKKFNDLILKYPISEDELLSISETVCKFVQYTRITDIDKYLFLDKELENPRLPSMISNKWTGYENKDNVKL